MGVPLLKLGSRQTGLRLPVETKDPKGGTTSPLTLGTPDMKPPAPQVKVPQGRSTSLLQWGSPKAGGPKALPLISPHRQTPSKGTLGLSGPWGQGHISRESSMPRDGPRERAAFLPSHSRAPGPLLSLPLGKKSVSFPDFSAQGNPGHGHHLLPGCVASTPC